MDDVLILGGYGNFGRRIAGLLVRNGIRVAIGGRNLAAAEKSAATLGADARALQLDASANLSDALDRHRPSVVVNTVGPFQGAGYGIAEATIAAGIPYVDIANGRDYVAGFSRLDAAALDDREVERRPADRLGAVD